MKHLLTVVGMVALLLTGVPKAMATEEAPYTVLKSDGIFELRHYEAQILVEIAVDGDLEDAGRKAFRPLFDYISGKNHSRSKIPMTAPVAQGATGEKIAMTAPVSQEPRQGKWAVSFVMPASYTMETIPVPDNPELKLRWVPARKVAAVRYSGFWSEKRYLAHRNLLEGWLRENNLSAVGEPVWARYNPPFTLWFLRRNEILIPVNVDSNT
ncbi:heme-binding protein [Geomonas limicola]|uniref:Heme-binding protein n=1 Tax=Geomonas limicola TaxID=2740186 RepID=A0A6V8N5U0_9BACT|nr:heme-binding protein [Geomonas limicola]GFO66659.1 heme-binding protein [Geomonas limicola]